MEGDLPLAEMILAAGALGTASFGVVEGFKFNQNFACAGFDQIQKALGPHTYASLAIAYGPNFESVLRGFYLKERGGEDLKRTLRQGLRLGLTPRNAEPIANEIGVVVLGEELAKISKKVFMGEDLNDDEKNQLGRFELAVDARIEAGLALASGKYKTAMRIWATGFSLLIAFGVFFILLDRGELEPRDWLLAGLVGLAAVPLAPIAKDVASAIQSAATALRARK